MVDVVVYLLRDKSSSIRTDADCKDNNNAARDEEEEERARMGLADYLPAFPSSPRSLLSYVIYAATNAQHVFVVNERCSNSTDKN